MQIIYHGQIGDESAGDINYRGRNFVGTKNDDQSSWAKIPGDEMSSNPNVEMSMEKYNSVILRLVFHFILQNQAP